MKTDIKIFIVGGHGGLGKLMMMSLKERYTDVSYFRNETECFELLDQKPDILIVDDSRRFSRSFDFLNSVKEDTRTHVIYVSRDTHILNIQKVIKSGAMDFVVKDPYTNYAVHKSIERLLKLTDNFKEKISNKEFFKSSSIQKRYPRRYKLARLMMF